MLVGWVALERHSEGGLHRAAKILQFRTASLATKNQDKHCSNHKQSLGSKRKTHVKFAPPMCLAECSSSSTDNLTIEDGVDWVIFCA